MDTLDGRADLELEEELDGAVPTPLPEHSRQGDLLGIHPTERARLYFPKLRFMGSKYRLLPWIYEVLSDQKFGTALDAFAGSGAVAYLLKAMGKKVVANDFLAFSSVINRALIENNDVTVPLSEAREIADWDKGRERFIEQTFSGIFFTAKDLKFLDNVWHRIRRLRNQKKKAVLLSALLRSCVKKQPRGVFTVAGDLSRYDDGRRDLRLSLKEHFIEQVAAYNSAVFDNVQQNRSSCGNIFDIDPRNYDLVYLDPPYVPRSDDNCYIKRYHFLEGLASYWANEKVMENTRVKKIEKRYTPFSYRKDAHDAFDRLFSKFANSTIILSYSSNGYPDLDLLVSLMRRYKNKVVVHEHDHRYHFGTHGKALRSQVQEYLIVGNK